jgi:phosphate starvation-inducible PhoH-like protein
MSKPKRLKNQAEKAKKADRTNELEGGGEQKKDNTESVFQGKALTFDLTVKDFPFTAKQQKMIDRALEKETNYIICQAPAGVGKTLVAVYIGLKLLQQGRVKNIYFFRMPVESASYGLGYLRGGLDEKMEAYTLPMIDQLSELLPQNEIKKLFEGGYIQSLPIGFLKGRSFNASFIILDEAEDLNGTDFRLSMSRLGKFSKMAIIGDQCQSNVKKSAFMNIFDLFNSEECQDNGIHCFSFDHTDIKRNKILGFVIERFGFLK